MTSKSVVTFPRVDVEKKSSINEGSCEQLRIARKRLSHLRDPRTNQPIIPFDAPLGAKIPEPIDEKTRIASLRISNKVMAVTLLKNGAPSALD